MTVDEVKKMLSMKYASGEITEGEYRKRLSALHEAVKKSSNGIEKKRQVINEMRKLEEKFRKGERTEQLFKRYMELENKLDESNSGNMKEPGNKIENNKCNRKQQIITEIWNLEQGFRNGVRSEELFNRYRNLETELEEYGEIHKEHLDTEQSMISPWPLVINLIKCTIASWIPFAPDPPESSNLKAEIHQFFASIDRNIEKVAIKAILLITLLPFLIYLGITDLALFSVMCFIIFVIFSLSYISSKFTKAKCGRYVGEWKNGKKNGQGTYSFSDGSKYVGEWEDDKFNGRGTYTLSDGTKYVGEWKNDMLNGRGTRTFSDGEKYLGEWKDNERNGQGTQIWPDGVKCVGEWKSDMLNGLGIVYDANGHITKSGRWKNDEYYEASEECFAVLINRTVPSRQAVEKRKEKAPEINRKNKRKPQLKDIIVVVLVGLLYLLAIILICLGSI